MSGHPQHGYARAGKKSPEYRSWRHMKDRCLNPNSADYSYYGGRGITICSRWLNSFELFLLDMGLRPSCKHTLERKDTNKGYSLNNCCWSTRQTQARNRTNNTLITIANVTHCLAEWIVISGLKGNSIMARHARGWSWEEAITFPLRNIKRGDTNVRTT